MKRPAIAATLVLSIAAFVLGGAASHAEEANPARVLLDKARDLNRTTRKWTDATQEISVSVFPSSGWERKQRIRLQTKKYGDDVTKTVASFLEPAAVRDMTVLQWVEAHKPNQTWLYSPEFGPRPRQYNGALQRDSFSATDFSYEDLSIRGEIAEWTADEAAAELVRDEILDGEACAVIEMVPKTVVDVTYKKIRLWLSREKLVVKKLQLESDNGRLEKTLLLSDFRTVGNIPTAHRMEMKTERSKSRTVVTLDVVMYDQGLKDEMFSQRIFEDRS